jgi:hypothetical protein
MTLSLALVLAAAPLALSAGLWEQPGPCQPIALACEKAGYAFPKNGGTPGHLLAEDCALKITGGKSVPGVELPASDAKACLELIKKRTSAYGDDENQPCKVILSACRSAGFATKAENPPPGKDLIADCRNPILRGMGVPNVAVDQEDVKECRKRLSKKRKKAQSQTPEG